MAVMKNSYSEPFILFYKLRDNNLSLIIPEMILTGNDFDQMTGIMRANVNVVKIIRENDVVSKIKTT